MVKIESYYYESDYELPRNYNIYKLEKTDKLYVKWSPMIPIDLTLFSVFCYTDDNYDSILLGLDFDRKYFTVISYYDVWKNNIDIKGNIPKDILEVSFEIADYLYVLKK